MDFLNTIMSPLGKQHCSIYFFLGIFSFIYASILLIIGVTFILKKDVTLGIMLIIKSSMLFIIYYLQRILYSICLKSL